MAQYGYPEELLAIPFVESRYTNLDPRHNPVGAAGMWQFIEKTASSFNLTNRLDLNEQTDAAMRYLGALNLRFENWGLAILSYNAGPARVQAGIEKTKSRDPWTVIRGGFENDRQYLAKVMAAALIMKYPQLRK